MKSEKLQLSGAEYTVRSLTMREVLPVMEDEPKNLVIELIKSTVTNGTGKPLGDKVLDMDFADFQAIMETFNKINGFADQGED